MDNLEIDTGELKAYVGGDIITPKFRPPHELYLQAVYRIAKGYKRENHHLYIKYNEDNFTVETDTLRCKGYSKDELKRLIDIINEAINRLRMS